MALGILEVREMNDSLWENGESIGRIGSRESSLTDYGNQWVNGYEQSMGYGQSMGYDDFGDSINPMQVNKPMKLPKGMLSTGYSKEEAMIGLMEWAMHNGENGLDDVIVSAVGLDFIANHPSELYNLSNINIELLRKLNFTSMDIAMLKVARLFNCYSTASTISRKFCIPYGEAEKIKYMDDLDTGRITINSNDDLATHIARMYSGGRRLTTSDLSLSTVTDIPRKVAVFGIRAERFKLFNSNTRGYKRDATIYELVKVNQNNIHCIVHKRPVIRYNESLEEEGVCRIIRIIDKKSIEVAFNKNYCVMCNKFIIVASLRKPDIHCGMISIICKDGTQVYVYAQMVAGDKQLNYYSGNQRVYDYGFFGYEIKPKLLKSAEKVYRHIGGIISSAVNPTIQFTTVPNNKVVSIDSDSEVGNDINFDKL